MISATRRLGFVLLFAGLATAPDLHAAEPAPFPADRLSAFMKAAIRRYNLQQSPSSLAYMVQPGRAGTRPDADSAVVISMTTVAPDGRTPVPQMNFDRIRMDLKATWPGIAEAVQMLRIDGQGLFVMPAALLFADNPPPDGVGRGSPLIVRIMLHEVLP